MSKVTHGKVTNLDMHLWDSEMRTLAKLYETARTIQCYTNLPTSLVLPLHVAPGLTDFCGQRVRHAQGCEPHVSVVPR